MGVGLGSLVNHHAHTVDGVPLPRLPRPRAAGRRRPCRSAATRPCTRSWRPSNGSAPTSPCWPRRSAVIDVLVGHLAWIALRLSMVTTDLPGHHGRLRDRPLRPGRPGRPRRRPHRDWPSPPPSPPSPPPSRTTPASPPSTASGSSRCSSSRGPSSPSPSSRAGSSPSAAGHAALPRGGAVPGPRSRATWASAATVAHRRLSGGADRGRVRAGPRDLPRGGSSRERAPSDRAPASPLRITPVAHRRRRSRRARRLVERNILVYRRGWIFFVSGFFEPFFYLLSIGVGLSKLVGRHPRRRTRWSPTRPTSPPGCWRPRP